MNHANICEELKCAVSNLHAEYSHAGYSHAEYLATLADTTSHTEAMTIFAEPFLLKMAFSMYGCTVLISSWRYAGDTDKSASVEMPCV